MSGCLSVFRAVCFTIHFVLISMVCEQTIVYRIVLMNGGDKEYERVLASFYATGHNNLR